MLVFFSISALVISVAAVVLSFIFITPEKKRARLNKFGKFLHDTLNFKFLIIEKVLQALYIFATAYAIVYGLFMLFYVKTVSGYFGYTHWYGGYGLLIMILGPIAIRIIYELMMLTILLVKNVISINNKLANQNEDDNKDSDMFAFPSLKDAPAAPVEIPTAEPVTVAPVAPVAPAEPAAPEVAAPVAEPAPAPEAAPSGCPNCGAMGENGVFCTKCGFKLK